MPELEWRGSQKQHPIEFAAKRPSRLEELGIFGRIISCKQATRVELPDS